MNDILKRLKEATRPDYKLNIAIFKFLHPEYADYVEGRGGLVHTCDGSDQRVLSDVRPSNYTASIDAALALVDKMLPDALWTIGHRGDETPNLFMCVIMPSSGAPFHETHQTPAIAILTALFTALEAKG